jgi:hypothetical protein
MNHEVLSHKDSFEIIFNKFKKGNPFSFVRFGDGDHILMYKSSIGQIIGGGNRFLVTEKLQKEIIECYNIENENFLIGTMLNDFSLHQMMKTNCKINHLNLPNLVERKEMLAMSCLFEIFLNDIYRFIEFSKELKKTSTMFVCNYNHENISKVYGDVKIFIEIPVTNCYSNIENWYKRILENLDKVDKVILSAGFAGRVVAKRLWKSGIKKIVLDFGSLSDVFIFQTNVRKRIKGRIFMEMIKSKIFINNKILLK